MPDASDRAKQAADEFLAGLKKGTGRLWLVAAGLCVVFIAFRSCSEVEPGEVAVRVNNVTGEVETLTRPGLIMDLPFGIQDVFVIDTSSQTFHMRGDRFVVRRTSPLETLGGGRIVDPYTRRMRRRSTRDSSGTHSSLSGSQTATVTSSSPTCTGRKPKRVA